MLTGRNDPSAEALYQEFEPKVRAYVRSKIQDPHKVEDIVSDVFLKVVQKLDSFDPAKASLSTWIYTITRNTVIDFFRTSHAMVEFEDYMGGEESDPYLTDDALDDLADALLTLKEKERDLIVMHYYMGYTLKAVAEKMGMSYINAKVIHKKALTGLQAFYAARHENES